VRLAQAVALLRRAAAEEATGQSQAFRATIEEALRELRKLAGKANASPEAREFLAYTEARVGDVARARDIVAELERSKRLSDFGLALVATLRLRELMGRDSSWKDGLPEGRGNNPALRYARAWLAYASNDPQAAYSDMLAALHAWPDARKAAVEVELYRMAARLGVEPDRVLRDVGVEEQGRSGFLRALARAYSRAGRYELALEVLDRVEQDDVAEGVSFARRRADLAFQLAAVKQASEAMVSALTAVKACGDACAGDVAEIRQRATDMARFFHTVFAATQDPAYFDAAMALYEHLHGGELGAVKQQISDLQRLKVDADPRRGLYDTDILGAFVNARVDVVRSCYRSRLLGEPELVGELRVVWSIDATGEVTGAASDPPPGVDGLSAVALCVMDRSRTRRFPARMVRGHTRLSVRYQVSPRPR